MDIAKQLAAELAKFEADYKQQLGDILEELNELRLDISELAQNTKSTNISPALLHQINHDHPNSACRTCGSALWRSAANARDTDKGPILKFNCLLSYAIDVPVDDCSKQVRIMSD